MPRRARLFFGAVSLLYSIAAIGATEEPCLEIGWTLKRGESSPEVSPVPVASVLPRLSELNPYGPHQVLRGYLANRSRLCPELLALDDTGDSTCLKLKTEHFVGAAFDHVLDQWDGELVDVTGSVTVEGGYFRRQAWSLIVGTIRPVSRSPSLAFCRDYDGPLEAAPRDRLYESRWDRYRYLESELADGSKAFLHPRKSLVGRFPKNPTRHSKSLETIDLSPPAPFTGRDVVKMEALVWGRFFYQLRDDRAYIWDQGAIRALEPWPISEVSFGEPEGVFYYYTEPATDSGEPATQYVKLLDRELKKHVLWQSTEFAVHEWEFSDGLELTIRRVPDEHKIKIELPETPRILEAIPACQATDRDPG